MIKEAYCSYETSKMLKEKGFNGDGGDCECHMFYCEYTEERIMPICEIGLVPDNEEVFFAPTHQMAMTWLREEKRIFIRIIEDCTGKVFRYEIYNHTPNNNGNYYISNTYVDSYKEAVEAALKHSLENLI